MYLQVNNNSNSCCCCCCCCCWWWWRCFRCCWWSCCCFCSIRSCCSWLCWWCWCRWWWCWWWRGERERSRKWCGGRWWQRRHGHLKYQQFNALSNYNSHTLFVTIFIIFLHVHRYKTSIHYQKKKETKEKPLAKGKNAVLKENNNNNTIVE